MRAILNNTEIIIQNIDRDPERPLFESIIQAFQMNKRIKIKDKISGPSEDIVLAECNKEEVSLLYDIDFGIMPIKCTEGNINLIFDVVNGILTK